MSHRLNVCMYWRTALATVIGMIAPLARAQPNAFTYQGELKSGGVPANGLYDFRFKLFNLPTSGVFTAPLVCVDNVQVTNGKFTATIDFGTAFMTSQTRYVEVDVRQDTGLDCTNTTGFGTLSPRATVTAAPLATYASKASALTFGNGQGVNAVSVDSSSNVGIGTTTPGNRLSVIGSADFTGNIGIGTTTPVFPLHVASTFAVLGLQDTGANSSQTGYVSYRNATGTETAWVGFGGTGDPDFSIINARTGGDIVLNPFSGNVGIGTGAPAAKLDVRGDVKLGSSGQYYAVKSANNDRVIRGRVGGNGVINAGTGFTISHTAGTGTYIVNFTTPFATAPIAVASSLSGTREVNVFNWGTTFASIGITDHAGAALEGGFSFIVVGD